MAKQITFNYEGVDYTLEFNRKTVIELESKGFKADSVEGNLLIQLPLLFNGAFQLHHPNMSRSETDKIIEVLGNKEELWKGLLEMYFEPYKALMGEEEDNNEGKVMWGANWEIAKETPQKE